MRGLIDRGVNVGEQEEELRRCGFGPIIDITVVRRLMGISFLAVLDYVYEVKQPSSRFEHTIGVAYLALKVSEHLSLDDSSSRVLVISNLLHDIGHAPFSHNSEPFLLEQRGVYHQGLTTVLLRSKQASDRTKSVGDVLAETYSDVRTAVLDLLIRKSSNNPNLVDVFFSPLSCDKVEGNDRTLRHLDLESVPPMRILDCLVEKDGRAHVRRSDIEVVKKFWDLEESLYWDHIYTVDVFAAEAMITKAFRRVYNSPERVIEFINSTDEQVLSTCEQDSLATELLERVRRRHLFTPLSEKHPALVKRFKDKFTDVRLDSSRRSFLESEVARELGIESDAVISHFSRRKHFPTEMARISQDGLFDERSSVISLEKVNQAFAAQKIPADFFDIFCAE
jgi:HD superfamily phosphohydrolase